MEGLAKIGERKFDTWVQPRALAYAMGGDLLVARRAIARRIEDGLLRTGARDAVYPKGQYVFHEVPVSLWADWGGHNGDQSFWSVGDTEILLRSRAVGAYGGRQPRVRLYGVRLNPSDVTKQFPDVQLSAAEPAAASRSIVASKAAPYPKVGRMELKAWVATFGAANPAAPFAVFLANARIHFRNQQVTERPLKAAIADLGMTKSRGNPAIRR